MKFKINSWSYYEIDLRNTLSNDENIISSKKIELNSLEYLGCYYKNSNDWILRISGMSFNITKMSYYKNLKMYLDKKLNIQLRKEKIEKINNLYDRNEENYIY